MKLTTYQQKRHVPAVGKCTEWKKRQESYIAQYELAKTFIHEPDIYCCFLFTYIAPYLG